MAGITANGSDFTSGNANAPDGVQSAFIKDGGGMSQTVQLNAGVYNVSFQAAQRVNDQSQAQEIEVLVDGNVVGTITPADTTYAVYETYNFSVTAGTHTIQFLGMSPSSADSTAFVDLVAISPVSDSLAGGSFEAPVLAANAYQFGLTGSPWQFSGMAGISANSSGFTISNPAAPGGSQVAIVKDGGSLTQEVNLDAGVYNLSFQAAQRVSPQTQAQQIEVLVDGVAIGTITPTGTTYGSYQTTNFSVTAGSHAIELLGLSPSSADSTAFIDLVSLAAVSGVLQDTGFETPALVATSYQIAPSGSSWSFVGLAGIASNGSDFTAGNPAAPDGNQVAFIKGTGSLSQSVYLDAGAYSVSFMAAQRENFQSSYQEIEVIVDGSVEGTATPSTTSYGLYQTPLFTVSSGPHTIELVGLNPGGGDNTAFVDEVTLS
jgi:archaellum component FlaG (FlaF/FlaG flagellin family)